jgi:hypothetical protein
MKKIVPVFLACFVLVNGFTNAGWAQSIVAGVSNDHFTGTTDKPNSKYHIKSAGVNVNALRNFENSFSPAQNVNWYKVKDGFMVYFHHSGIKKVAGYDLKGQWLYYFASYTAEKLPDPIWHRIKNMYYEYSIIWVNLIQTSNKTIYMVHLENKGTFKNVKVGDDDNAAIEEISKR